MMPELLAALGIGFLGSLHCIGMCGPIVLAYSLNARPSGGSAGRGGSNAWSSGTLHHAAFHAGRLMTYSVTGAAAAGLLRIFDPGPVFWSLKPVVVIVGGAGMVLLGLFLLRVVPVKWFLDAGSARHSVFFRRVKPLLSSGGAGSRVLLGIVAGFLPCMLSWAMMIRAALTMDPLAAFLGMLFFGLGTMPALFLPGLLTTFLSIRVRLAGERVAAAAVMAMGLMLLVKGVYGLA